MGARCSGRAPRSAGRHAGRSRCVPIALAILFTLVATGCSGVLGSGYWFLETPRRAYLIEGFDEANQDVWEAGPGGPTNYWDTPSNYSYDVSGGYYISHNYRNFIITRESFPASVEIQLDWGVWTGPGALSLDNYDLFDFRVILDSSESDGYNPEGPIVELKLWEFGSNDILRVRDGVEPSTSLEEADVQPALGLTEGRMTVVFDPYGERARISATVEDIFGNVILQETLETDRVWADEARVMIEAVGYYYFDAGPPITVQSEARVLDAVRILDPGVVQ